MFGDDLGTVNGFQIKLVMNENAVPRFCKARPVPYAMKQTIEIELNRLVKEEILEPVEMSELGSSNCASPKGRKRKN